jgi:hypothetical protein
LQRLGCIVFCQLNTNAKEKYAFHNRVEIIEEYFPSCLAGLGRSFFKKKTHLQVHFYLSKGHK